MTISQAAGPEPERPHILRVAEFANVEIVPDDILRGGHVEIYPSLHRKGYLDVRISPTAVQVYARGFVGIIPVNDNLTLEVVPRVPLANLSRLLAVSKSSPVALVNATRLYDTEGEMYPSLAVIYANALRQCVDVIVDRGLFKEYQRITEETSYPRGRIEIGATLQQMVAKGLTNRAVVSYFHRSVDNAINRCLVYAVWRLSQYIDQVSDRLPRRQRQNAGLDLNYAWHVLQGVELDRDEDFLTDSLVTGAQSLPTLRSYYRPALDLALAIIGRQAVVVERTGARVELPSLVVNMSTVFEAYVREVLVSASVRRRWPAAVLNGNQEPPVGGAGYLFAPGDAAVKTTPDIVMRRRAGGVTTYPIVVEVKYKPADGLPDRDDLNQVITYGVAYKSPIVVIAQPRALHSPLISGIRYLGGLGGVRVFQYVMDLNANLQAEELQLADAVEQGLFGSL